MNTPKKTAVIAALVTMLGTGAIGIGTTMAAENTSVGIKHGMQDLVTAIATKFNLNTAEVQAVFDAQRDQMQTEHKAEMEKTQAQHEADLAAKLTQAVTDGKLTQAQADAITAKRAELKTEREAMMAERKEQRLQTREEMEATMKTKKEALDKWAKDNNIPSEYLPVMIFLRGPELAGPGRDHAFGPGEKHAGFRVRMIEKAAR
jgi:hypothetical protein